jgi:hypothetical protein
MGPLMTALVLKALENGNLKGAISEDGVQLDRLSNEELERELEGAPLLAQSRATLSPTASGAERAGKAGYSIATKLSSAVSGAGSAASAALKVHSTALAIGTVGAAAVAAPALGVVALGKLVAHLVRFWKTQKHVNQLVIIYFMALDAGESDDDLLNAMVYAMQQKKVKLDRNGIASVIPGLVELESGELYQRAECGAAPPLTEVSDRRSHSGSTHVAFGSVHGLGLSGIVSFAAQYLSTQWLCTRRSGRRLPPRNTHDRAAATRYLGRTWTGWNTPACWAHGQHAYPRKSQQQRRFGDEVNPFV